MKYRKQYIKVAVEILEDGIMMPRMLYWIDGRRYDITKVKAVRPAPALKAGGQGDRYTVEMEGQERYLFFERPTDADDDRMIGRWFVEAPELDNNLSKGKS